MIIRTIIIACFMSVGVYAPAFSSLPHQSTTTTTTAKEQNAFSLLDIIPTPRATTTTVGATTTTEPNQWDLDWLATLETPTDKYWDKVAQCETSGNWQNGGQWAGGLGIYIRTWRGFGGAEFAPSPDKATRAEQIIVANRVALHGYRNQSGKETQPVGFKGWGCIRYNDYLEPTVPNPWTAWRNR